MSATDIASTLEEQYFAAVKQAQDLTVDAVRSVAGLVTPLIPDVPALPFADQLPSPSATVAAGFDLAEKVINIQRDFATQLFEAVAGSSSSN